MRVTRNTPAIGHWTRLERFLILGNEDGHYCAGEREPAMENAPAVRECLQTDGGRVVKAIVEISNSARAPRNDASLFALAVAASPAFADSKTNVAALAALPCVARTGAHLCKFAAFAKNVRGWGRGLRSAIAEWYLAKPAGELAGQILKSQHRNGWSHRDLLRLAHPKAATPAHNALFQWAVDGEPGHLASPEILEGELRQLRAFELARKAASEDEVVRLIEDYRLTDEMIPAAWKNSARVWEALIEQMPYAAMLRHLGKLTSVGLVRPRSAATALVVARLSDRKRVAHSKIHPVGLLAASMAYKQGHGGKLEWAPVANVIDALEEAFDLALGNVEPTGRRIYLAVDASGSMQRCSCSGMPSLTPAMASAAMAVVYARTEPNCTIAGFADEIVDIDITRNDWLRQACTSIARRQRGTNASLPMQDALARALTVDAFVLLTDEETWVGDQHPVSGLEWYRRETGVGAKLVVNAMAASRYSVTDPGDVRQIDIAGFDASVPQLIARFV